MGLFAFNRVRERQAELAALKEQCEELGIEVVDTDDNESLKEKLTPTEADAQGDGQEDGQQDPGADGQQDPGADAVLTDGSETEQGDGQQDPDADGVAHHEYEDMTVDELRGLASQREIPYSGLKKAELIEALRAADAAV